MKKLLKAQKGKQWIGPSGYTGSNRGISKPETVSSAGTLTRKSEPLVEKKEVGFFDSNDPYDYSKSKIASLNDSRSFEEVYRSPASGGLISFDPIGDAVNPLLTIEGISQIPQDIREGNYLSAGMNALEAVPLLGAGFRGLKGVKRPLINNTIPFQDNNFDLEQLRSAYHNREHYLTPQEHEFLSKYGTGLRADYRNRNQLPPPPSEIQFMPDGSMRTIYNQQPITDYISGSYRPDYIDLRRRPTYDRDLLAADYSNLVNGYPAASSFMNYPNLTREQVVQAWRTLNNRVQSTPKPKNIINKSGLTKEEVLQKASSKDTDVISKMTEEEFQETVLKPTGEVVPYAVGKKAKDVISMTDIEYSNELNKVLDNLNNIIPKHNKSGIKYKVQNIDEHGVMTIYTPEQILPNGSKIEEGTQQIQFKLKPGRWQGVVEDISSMEYHNSIPGLIAQNTSSGIFPDASRLRGTPGTGFYTSVNEWLKTNNLGRLADGASGQTRSMFDAAGKELKRGSFEVWDGYVKKNKAFGFYNDKGNQVSAIMRTLFPTATAITGAASLEEKQDGGFFSTPTTGVPYQDKEYMYQIGGGKEEDNDSWIENILEIIDPTGVTSYDDVYRAYKDSGLSKELFIEAVGALPLIGKFGKVAKGSAKILRNIALDPTLWKQTSKRGFPVGAYTAGTLGAIGTLPYWGRVSDTVQAVLGSKDASGYKSNKGRPTYDGRNIFPSTKGWEQFSEDKSYGKYQEGGENTPPEDWKEFQKFNETLPNNLRDDNYKYGDSSTYNLYGMWEASGKPNSFEKVKDTKLFPLQDDGLYHGFGTDNEGLWLKSKKHPTAFLEYLQAALNPILQNQQVVVNPEGYFGEEQLQYIPRKKQGGEMIRRKDGSYSRRGLWDNIRENRGSGKKPTREMLEQERKIKDEYQIGGSVYDKETDNLLAKITSMIADGEDPDMVAGSLVDNGYSEEVVDSLMDAAITSLSELGDYEEEDVDRIEDIKVLREGGIPDRYKNQGFTKVGAKRKSNRPGKKWMVLAKKGDKYKVVHGGYKGMKDYTQHGSEKRRERFWSRMGGKDSSKAKDQFSPLYWHKKFGTWAEGGNTPIEDPEGQRKHPGKTTRIPSNRITMEGINYPVLAIGDNGKANLMLPGEEYLYLGVNYVDEVPFSK
jgi:hypothetical protein